MSHIGYNFKLTLNILELLMKNKKMFLGVFLVVFELSWYKEAIAFLNSFNGAINNKKGKPWSKLLFLIMFYTVVVGHQKIQHILL